MNNKGMGALGLIGILLVAYFVFQSGALNTFFSGSQPAVPGQPAPGQPVCASSAETLTTKGFEKYTTTAIPNSEIWINGVDQGNKTDGSTTSVGIGSDVGVLYGHQSGIYFTDYATFKMPCAPASTADPLLSLGAHELLRADTNPATNGRWIFYNSDNGNINGISDNNTFGSGSSGSWNMELQFQNKRAYNPERVAKVLPNGQAVNSKMIATVELNTTVWDISQATWTEGYPVISNPSFSVLRGTANQLKTFELPACPRASETCLIKGTLNVKAKSGQNPAAVTDQDAINVTIVAEDFDLKTTGNSLNDIIFSYQDDLGNAIGIKQALSTLLTVD